MAEMDSAYQVDADLAKLLVQAANSGKSLTFVTPSGVFEVYVERKRRGLRRIEDYDTERARQALEESLGVLSGIDAEAFIAEMKANRE